MYVIIYTYIYIYRQNRSRKITKNIFNHIAFNVKYIFIVQ